MSTPPPPDPDELASDLVDGLLPDDAAAARLRGDPAIAARIEAIEAARAALRVPPPSPPGAVDRAVAATFAALDRSPEQPPVAAARHLRPVGTPSAPGGDPARGGPWAPARRAGGSRRSSGMQWLAAAAAIVVLGLVTFGLLSSNSGSDSEDRATSAGTASGDQATADAPLAAEEEMAGEGDDTSADGGSGAGAEATTAPPDATTLGRRELGAVDSPDELADRIRAGVAAPSPTGPGESTDRGSGGQATADEAAPLDQRNCPGLTSAGDPTRGEVVYVADAVLDGNPVLVHIYDTGDGELQLVATDASCTDVVDRPYDG